MVSGEDVSDGDGGKKRRRKPFSAIGGGSLSSFFSDVSKEE